MELLSTHLILSAILWEKKVFLYHVNKGKKTTHIIIMKNLLKLIFFFINYRLVFFYQFTMNEQHLKGKNDFKYFHLK